MIAVVVRTIGRPFTKTDVERLSDLLTWTEDELTALNKKNWGPFFRMAIWEETDPAESLAEPAGSVRLIARRNP